MNQGIGVWDDDERLESGRAAPAEPNDDRILASVSASAVVLAVLAVLAAAYFARSLLLPLVLAIFVAMLLGPCVAWLVRRGVPRMVAAFLITTAFAAVIIVGVANLFKPLETWLAEVPRALTSLQRHGTVVEDRLRSLSATKAQVEEIAKEVTGDDERKLRVEVDEGSKSTQKAAGYLLNLLYSLAISLLMVFFVLSSGNLIVRRAVLLGRTREARRRAVRVARTVQSQFSRYLFTVTCMNAALGVTTALMLKAMGIPDPWLWGILAGVLNYAPFVGTMITAAAITVAAAASQDGLAATLLPGLAYVALNGLEANLLTPALLGERLSLNPIFVLLSIVVLAWLWGAGGAFVAVPTLVVLKAILSELDGDAAPWARILHS